jgi:hypothetical protein
MFRKVTLLCGLLAAIAVAPASAMNWSIGANLGAQFISPDVSESITLIGWPIGGLRVGFTGDNPTHEFYLDTALSMLSQDDASLNEVLFMGNYQYNFGSQGSTAPYVTAGVGIAMLSADSGSPGGDVSATSTIFGGGVGLRHKMGNGHGTLRGEVRYDMQGEGEDSSVIVVEEAGIFGIRLGFDLWDK